MRLKTQLVSSIGNRSRSEKSLPRQRIAPLFESLESRQLLSAVSVSLTPSFNRVGIITEGTSNIGIGFDSANDFYSATKLGTSVTFNSNTFKIGPSDANDVVFASGQAIPLTAGKFASLSFLAAAAPGSQASQIFKVNYTDGTSQSFTRGISDWIVSHAFANESIAKTTAYPLSGLNGQPTNDHSPPHVYGYTLALNASKTVKSITLPNNAKVGLFAIDLVPKPVTQVNLSSFFNRVGIITGGISNIGIGFDSANDFYSGDKLGTSVTFNSNTFKIGPSDANDVVFASGQAIPLTAGKFASLSFLAAAAPGSQASQIFKVNYTDGTSQSFTRGISDWIVSHAFANESIAKTTPYPLSGLNGEPTNDHSPPHVYGYTLALNASKTVKSITLPNNAKVGLFAIDLAS